MKYIARIQPRKAVPVGAAIAIGVFLTVASHALDWSRTSTLVVAGALVALLGLLGPPLVLLNGSDPQPIGRKPIRGGQKDTHFPALEELLISHNFAGAFGPTEQLDVFKNQKALLASGSGWEQMNRYVSASYEAELGRQSAVLLNASQSQARSNPGSLATRGDVNDSGGGSRNLGKAFGSERVEGFVATAEHC